MKFTNPFLPDDHLAMIHGGMGGPSKPNPPSSPYGSPVSGYGTPGGPPKVPGSGFVSNIGTQAFAEGHHHNAKAVAGSPTYQKIIGYGTMFVASPSAFATHMISGKKK